jgi:hypothetical protein
LFDFADYRARFYEGGIKISERKHRGKPLNFVEVTWGIFWMMISGILYVRIELLMRVMAWADGTFHNSIVTAVMELISIFVVTYICLIVAVKIASFAKTRILAMFFRDVEIINTNIIGEE